LAVTQIKLSDNFCVSPVIKKKQDLYNSTESSYINPEILKTAGGNTN
jgi:hypothetical protein